MKTTCKICDISAWPDEKYFDNLMIFEDAINVYFCTSLKVSCRRAQHPVHCDACARYATARSEYEPLHTLSWYNIPYFTMTYHITTYHCFMAHTFDRLPIHILQAPWIDALQKFWGSPFQIMLTRSKESMWYLHFEFAPYFCISFCICTTRDLHIRSC